MLNLYLTGEMVPTFDGLAFDAKLFLIPSMVAVHF